MVMTLARPRSDMVTRTFGPRSIRRQALDSGNSVSRAFFLALAFDALMYHHIVTDGVKEGRGPLLISSFHPSLDGAHAISEVVAAVDDLSHRGSPLVRRIEGDGVPGLPEHADIVAAVPDGDDLLPGDP